jgi:hypothetical protein
MYLNSYVLRDDECRSSSRLVVDCYDINLSALSAVDVKSNSIFSKLFSAL